MERTTTQRNGAWRPQAAVVAVLFAALVIGVLPSAGATDAPTGSILVVAPHPDDDVLTAAGITSQESSNVTIAYLTNGESCCPSTPNIGTIRQNEAVAAQTGFLNRNENDLIFFGYPSGNGRLASLLNNPSATVTGATGRTETYASRGLGGTDYHSYRTGNGPATYTGNNFVADMTALIDDLRPDDIFTTGMFDRHTDHQAAYRVIVAAVEAVNASNPSYRPTLHSTIVHVIPQAYWGKWPVSVSPTVAHTPIPELETTTGGTLRWDNRESFPVPSAMRKTNLNQNPKWKAIDAHDSQQPEPWLYRFTRRDEIFWSEVLPNSNAQAVGVGDSYPDLVTKGGQATIAAIGVLGNDVPGNLKTKMVAELVAGPSNGTLTFNDDGSFTYTHDGSMVGTDSFIYRPTQNGRNGETATVSITITLPNVPPIADAGGPYQGDVGNEIVFDGSASTDTDGTIISYIWDFGDGTSGTGISPTHTYASAGDFVVELTVTDDDGAVDTGTSDATIADPPPPVEPVITHRTGLVDPSQGKWYLYDDTGALSTTFFFGNPGDYPFMGDWNGDGVETPGMYRQSDGYVYLKNANEQGVADIRFFFGNPGDVPIAGDFNGDGFDTVSIYRPSNQTFYIINELGKNDGGLGAAESSYVFGNPGDKPFVGDFDDDGVETVGLHRESSGLVYFRNSHTQGNADNQFIFGDPGDRLIAGDWTGDGVFTPALFRPSNTTMYFKYTNSQGNADDQFVPTPSGTDWLPVGGRTQ